MSDHVFAPTSWATLTVPRKKNIQNVLCMPFQLQSFAHKFKSRLASVDSKCVYAHCTLTLLSISFEADLTRAGVVSWHVDASCVGMAIVSPFGTLVDVCVYATERGGLTLKCYICITHFNNTNLRHQFIPVTVFPWITPPGELFFNTTFLGGVIFQCHLFTSDRTKFISNRCKTKLVRSKNEYTMGSGGVIRGSELFFRCRCREGSY